MEDWGKEEAFISLKEWDRPPSAALDIEITYGQDLDLQPRE